MVKEIFIVRIPKKMAQVRLTIYQIIVKRTVENMVGWGLITTFVMTPDISLNIYVPDAFVKWRKT